MLALWNAFYFIVALGILVTIHEFGHFWVARRCGVKVLTFSVGFGKAIWQRRGKDGVNYVIAAIPLGGYVKMLDEREGEVADADKDKAFNRKSVWARMAIVLAGPMANFILAIVLYWWVYGMGITSFNTMTGEVVANSIAGKAGLQESDLVTHVDGNKVYLRSDLIKRIAVRLGDDDPIELSITRKNGVRRDLKLDISDWKVDASRPQLLESLGIKHKAETLAPILDFVVAESPADQAGIKSGDRVTEFNGQSVNYWADFRDLIRANPDETVELTVERGGELLSISVVIGSQNVGDGQKIGQLGVRPLADDLYYTRQGDGVAESLAIAAEETMNMVVLSAKLFAKLLTGDLSIKSLSGPIAIAEGAGSSASAGLVYFISFVAMISVNLGFINLLPIPVLDGGHLLYFVVEAIKGKPLPEKVQEVGLQVGMIIVFTLMAFAIFSDLSRF